MPPHNSSDSWIDLSEIAKLVEQLMPSGQSSQEAPQQLPPFQESNVADSPVLKDAPISLIPEIPRAWEKSLPESLSSFPSLDDLEIPEPAGPEPALSAAPKFVKEEPEVGNDVGDADDDPEAREEEDEDEISPPKVISMQSKVRADETLAHIRRLGRNSVPEAVDHEPFLKAEDEPEPEPAESGAGTSPASELDPQPATAAEEPEVAEENPQSQEESTAEETKESPDGLARALFLPRGSLRVRLHSYGDWVREVTDCTRFQVTDAQGYSLMEDESEQEESFVGSALQLIKVLESVGPKIGGEGTGSGVYLPLGTEQWLCVLGCNTRYGPVCLSMVTRAPLSAPAAEELTRTLRRTLEAVA